MKKMGGGVCMDEGKFNAPLPLIGIYIAGASLVCMLAMAFDTVDGLRHRKLWFPCKFFPINGASLTLLSVATKIPLDLSTPMPGPEDQLAKLSGTVFICVFMCFSMPSLGVMPDPEILANMAAVFIFVITAAVNVCIQLGTGVIYRFQAEHIVVLICMLLLLGLMCSSALIVDTTNQILNDHYDSKAPVRLQKAEMDYIRDDVTKVWLMAHTSSPQYVVARSVMSTAAGALTCLSVLLLIQAEIRAFFTHFCNGQSDYQWANRAILISQTLTILVGSIAPALRWFNAISYRKSGGLKHCINDFRFEKYWVQRLEGWKENPLHVYFRSRCARKRAHILRNMLLDICISMQKTAVQISKSVRLVSALLVLLFRNLFCCICLTCPAKGNNGFVSSRNLGLLDSVQRKIQVQIQMGSVSDSGLGIAGHELNNYVLHVEEEDDLVLWMSRRAHKDMERWIEKGRREECGSLLQLLAKSSVSEGFKGMRFFDNNNVPPIPTPSSDIPPNCWTLPAVTLITIAVSLSRFYGDRIKMMVAGLAESLDLVNFIERNLDFRGLRNMRKAATIVWSGIDLKEKWLDLDLANLPLNTNTSSFAVPSVEDPNLFTALQIIKCLSEIGKMRVMAFEKETVSIPPRQWPPEALAGNSLYRISETILEYHRYNTTEELLKWIESILADIVGACLTNLPYAIFVEYVSGMVGERERRVRNAVYVLGKAQNFQDALHWSHLQDPDDENANVDRWRSGEANPFVFHHHDTRKVYVPLEETTAELEWEQVGLV